MFKDRKFDIRIWTVLTSTSPCISWVWQKFYIRLSANNFDLDDDSNDINLTNWAIQKNNKDKTDECMLDYDEFRTWFEDQFGSEQFEKILKQIYGQMLLVTATAND